MNFEEYLKKYPAWLKKDNELLCYELHHMGEQLELLNKLTIMPEADKRNLYLFSSYNKLKLQVLDLDGKSKKENNAKTE